MRLPGGGSACHHLSPVQTRNLNLIPHLPEDLFALADSSAAYEARSGFRIAAGVREFLLQASPEFLAQLRGARTPDPWKFGFAVVHSAENIVIGMCGFAGSRGTEGGVEIAYSVAPSYEGRGYATEVAQALIEFAQANGLTELCAHTLPEENASTRVLEKCGFQKIGEVVDSESQAVWKWSRGLRKMPLEKRDSP
jgi:RimJ/RimL family protein N-acetyltransferase